MLARGRDHHGHDQKGVMRNSIGKKVGQDEDIALKITNEKNKSVTGRQCLCQAGRPGV